MINFNFIMKKFVIFNFLLQHFLNGQELIAQKNSYYQDEATTCSCTPDRINTVDYIHTDHNVNIFDSSFLNVNDIPNTDPAELKEHMIEVPGQTYFMGTADPLIRRDGEERRQVHVDSFLLDTYEVSNHDFKLFADETGYITDSEKYGWSFVFKHAISKETMATLTQAVLHAEWWLPVTNSSWKDPEGPDTNVFHTNRGNLPVVHMSWNDAVAYCNWRNHSRLPTEAEWELAAGRGKDTLFPWGDKIMPGGAHRANIFQGTFPKYNSVRDGFEFLAPVDAFPPQNELGFKNIVGNAWEWVHDWWTIEHKVDKLLLNPQGPATGKERTKKGGSFLCHKEFCYRYRVAARHYSTPDSATSNSGFRCAKSI